MMRHLSQSASLRDLLPPAVAVASMPISANWMALPAAEQVFVSRAVEKRQREFATGRMLARRLLREIGQSTEAIGQRGDRTPEWPVGIIGSISHCDDLCFVAVAKDDVGFRSVGVDVEPAAPLPTEAWNVVAHCEEQVILASHWSNLAIGMRRLFSAKEAIYKCLYPVCRQAMEFLDVEVDFETDGAAFRAHSHSRQHPLRSALAKIDGRQFEIEGRIFSSATWRH